jgi:hypothetical protein
MAFLLVPITLSWRFLVTSFFFSLLGSFVWGKRAKSTGTGVRLQLQYFYGYLSQQQHFIANPPLLALFKKGAMAHFHNSLKCLNACISYTTDLCEAK